MHLNLSLSLSVGAPRAGDVRMPRGSRRSLAASTAQIPRVTRFPPRVARQKISHSRERLSLRERHRASRAVPEREELRVDLR